MLILFDSFFNSVSNFTAFKIVSVTLHGSYRTQIGNSAGGHTAF